MNPPTISAWVRLRPKARAEFSGRYFGGPQGRRLIFAKDLILQPGHREGGDPNLFTVRSAAMCVTREHVDIVGDHVLGHGARMGCSRKGGAQAHDRGDAGEHGQSLEIACHHSA
jgi:hypothetical protein